MCVKKETRPGNSDENPTQQVAQLGSPAGELVVEKKGKTQEQNQPLYCRKCDTTHKNKDDRIIWVRNTIHLHTFDRFLQRDKWGELGNLFIHSSNLYLYKGGSIRVFFYSQYVHTVPCIHNTSRRVTKQTLSLILKQKTATEKTL